MDVLKFTNYGARALNNGPNPFQRNQERELINYEAPMEKNNFFMMFKIAPFVDILTFVVL